MGTERDLSNHDRAGAAAPGLATDPVCGMTVNPATTPHHARHGGQEFHFCGAGCRAKFMADPRKYLNDGERPGAPAAAAGTL
ncbi:MAG: YHS domain-containing protein [Caulobacterales bacterium]